MFEVLTASVAFPAVIFTAVLALALIYWLFVILGALDIDVLGGGEADADVDIGIDGAAKGALEGVAGAAKGGLEGVAGAAKGGLEGAAGAAKGAAEGLADVDADDGGLAALFTALQLNRAPATVVLTLLALFGWLTCVLAIVNVAPVWASWGLSVWMFKLATLIAAIVIAFGLTSLAVRPLGPLFVTRPAASNKDLVGRVCVVASGRVDDRFGQATIEDGGAGFILDVRCDEAGVLRKGDKALVVSWDAEKEVFHVEPMEDVLAERRIEAAAAKAADPVAGGPAPAEGQAEVSEGHDTEPADKPRRHVG